MTDTVEELLAFVRLRAGVTCPENRRPSLEAAIRRAQRALGVPDAAALLDRVRQDATAFERLMVELTVGETYFFRDRTQLEFIREHLLALLVARDRTVRVWSAGCSSGEEIYTIAMLLHDLAPTRKPVLIGTDIAPARLRVAQRGLYRNWSLRSATDAERARWFRREGDDWRLRPEIGELVRFQRLNLLDPRPYLEQIGAEQGFDLVLCRNVLIYFEREAGARVARRLRQTLQPGGHLVLGATDPMFFTELGVKPVATVSGLAYPAGTAVKPAVRKATSAPPLPRPHPPVASDRPEPVPPARAPDVEERYASIIALADAGEVTRALDATSAELERHPQLAPLHTLHGLLLLGLGDITGARGAVRSALYLDRDAAGAQLVHAQVLTRTGDVTSARRAWQSALRALVAMPGEQRVLPLNETAARLAQNARAQLDVLKEAG